jgi:hypothetical protein
MSDTLKSIALGLLIGLALIIVFNMGASMGRQYREVGFDCTLRTEAIGSTGTGMLYKTTEVCDAQK